MKCGVRVTIDRTVESMTEFVHPRSARHSERVYEKYTNSEHITCMQIIESSHQGESEIIL